MPTWRSAQRWLSILTTFAHYLLRSTISDINPSNSPLIPQSNAGYRSAIRLAKTIACALQFSPRWGGQHHQVRLPQLLPRSTRCGHRYRAPLRHHDRAIRSPRCSLDEAWEQLARIARGCTPFWQGTADSHVSRAITQCNDPPSTSTPFVRGIREGDPGGVATDRTSILEKSCVTPL